MDNRSFVKILFLDHTAQLGGGELALLSLAQRLDRRRFHSEVILFADGPLAAALRESNIAVEILPLAESIRTTGRGTLGIGSLAQLSAVTGSIRFVWRLARHIRQKKPDIIHCNSLKADILGGLAARLAGAKIIWHIRDRIETDYLPAPVVKIFRFLARHVPHEIIANSHATLETLHLPSSKPSAVVYSGISTPAAVPNAQCQIPNAKCPILDAEYQNSDSAITDNTVSVSSVANNPEPGILNLEDNNASEALPNSPNSSTNSFVSSCLRGEQSFPVIVLVGRISPWKGQDIFIRSAGQVLKTFPDCRFQIVGSALFGEDALETQLKQLAASLGVGDRVEFLGFRKDVPEIIAAGTLLVHASTVSEPFGQVIIQAMAECKPVVATRGGGVLEIVDDGVTGLLVPMKDVHAMADAICKILSNPDQAAEMGRAGNKKFLEKFTIEKTIENLQEVYAAMSS
ncbi:MAG: glycosyltransferase family 4 protein [Planctomycetes bacterium]|nr:glycosyltransferase family 4 protein [Planctomycetota bacterium]